MAVSTQTAAYLSQLGLLTFVDPTGGPDGPHSTVAYKLVPTGGWNNGQRFPHSVTEDLKVQNFSKTVIEGIEYYLVPDESTNTPGLIAHYAQRTGVSDLRNPVVPGTGVNRAVDSLQLTENYSEHTVSPDAVSKYVKDADSYEEARKSEDEVHARVRRQIRAGEGDDSTPKKGSK